MKRLVSKMNKKSDNNIPNVDKEMMQRLRNEVMEDINNKNMSNMILLKQLDEADVRHDKCPMCKYEPMSRKEGFKICPLCGSIYKMLDGNGYMIIG